MTEKQRSMLRNCVLHAVFSVVFVSGIGTALADASIMPVNFSGNLGYFYSYTRADAGADGDTSQVTGQLNMNSYIWQPWLARLNASGTVSAYNSSVESYSTESKLGSYNVNFNLFPSSRFPFSATLLGTDDFDLSSDKINLNSFGGVGEGYRVRYLGLRQSIIGRGGDRFDVWYQDRFSAIRDRRGSYSRDLTATTYNDFGQTEKTVGMSYKGRLKHHNFDLTGAHQEFDRTTSSNVNTHDTVSFTHHYLPTTGNSYLKTLASYNDNKNKLADSNGGYIGQSHTTDGQVSSFLYWRPEYRPFSMTGMLRLNQRKSEPDYGSSLKAIEEQRGGYGSLAANYEITRRLRLSGTFSVTGLDTERGNSVSSAQNASLLYQSDIYFFREFNYSWYADATAGNRTASEYETIEFAESVSLGAGHSANRRWVTGNRSTLRVNLQQSLRENFAMHDETADNIVGDLSLFSRKFVFDTPGTSLNHTASMTWTDDARQSGSSLFQLSAMDSRSLEDEISTQLINTQISHTIALDRVSSFSANASMQSTRRMTSNSVDKPFFDEFLTTASGRLSYQHERLFGIYKLKFRTKLDAYTSVNRSGGDRSQADWENRIGYAIGKLSLSAMYRQVFSDSGLGVYTALFNLNRSF